MTQILRVNYVNVFNIVTCSDALRGRGWLLTAIESDLFFISLLNKKLWKMLSAVADMCTGYIVQIKQHRWYKLATICRYGELKFKYRIARNFARRKFSLILPPGLVGKNFCSAILCNEHMATFTVLAKVCSIDNTKVPGLSEIFVQRKFSAIQYLYLVQTNVSPGR